MPPVIRRLPPSTLAAYSDTIRLVFEEQRVSPREAGFAIRPLENEDVDAVLQMLTEAFGAGFDHQWFQWKHRHGPWGPSLGWVADSGSGLLGVRLFLPWRLRERDTIYRAFRPCDTVTAPEARGRGVFRSLTEHAIAHLDDDVDFLFNTPNEKSRPGYLKMGFVEWGEVSQRVSIVLPRRAALIDDPKPVSQWSGVKTLMDDRFLAWRYRDCPGWHYSTFGMESEGPNGIVCRIRSWHGIRLMVVSELWGEARQRVDLVRGAAHELGARMMWYGEPFPGVGVPLLRRSRTTITRYDNRAGHPGQQALSLGDVEDVL